MRAERSVQLGTFHEGDNLVALLLARALEPGRVAASFPDRGIYRDITWSEVLAQVKRVSEALLALGVQPGDRVAIFAATSLRWVVCDLAVSAARAVTVPIYASNTPDECRYILNHSQAVALFVDHDQPEGKQAGRASRIRERVGELSTVRDVVLFEGAAAGPRELSWADFEAKARGVEQGRGAFEARVAEIKGSDLCCIIYTSGTTGDPKGVMLTHGNWLYEAQALGGDESVLQTDDSVMLFLPLAHSFAQAIKAAWLGLGFRMSFAESTDRLMANLVTTRPTILPSVPRVFEKVYNGVVANGISAPGVKGRLFRWAMGEFDAYAAAKAEGKEYTSLGLALAKRLVFSKVRKALDEKLGGRMRLFISGGAPLSLKIGQFFELLGYPILEGYGLTETSAGSTLNTPGRWRLGSVGPALPRVEVKIAPDGEILIRGPNIMRGYFRDEAATAEALEPDGWFHSGDIGELDPQGFLRITDRKKDIIVTAGGKNVAPQNIENQLKTHPIISQAMVHGDRRKYLTALITVNEETARRIVQEAGGREVESYAELAKRPEVRQAVEKAVESVNAHEPPHSQLKKFELMDHDFTQESGELTPTLKVKRKLCGQRYKAILDGLYDEAPVS